MLKKKLYFICLFCISIFFNPTFAHAGRSSVAVIGGGGSGLTTAWLLEEEFDVTLFESQNRLGGHANTVEVNINGAITPIEAGFEFISKNQFPHFYNLLKNILKVELHEYMLTSTFYHTESQDVLILPPVQDGVVEWHSLWPHDIFTMVEFDILLLEGKRLIETQDVGITLEDFADSLFLTKSFKDEFLYPFLAAGWGTNKENIKKFAAYNALKYVVEGKESPGYKWIEIVGGTQKYIKAMEKQLAKAEIKLSAAIANIVHDQNKYIIIEKDGTISQFDHLVIATNAMQSCELLKNIPETRNLRSILGNIEYFKTTIAIHGDKRFMPKDAADWSVMNVRYDGENSAGTVYKKWLSPSSPIFKSWVTYDVRPSQDQGGALPEPLYALAYYDHPKADLKYFQAQKAIAMVQGDNNLWFAGNYTHDNDSHESAIMSAVNIAGKLSPKSQRLDQLTDINP